MIKTLLNADEDPPPGTKVVVEETVLNPPSPPANPQAVEDDTAENTAVPENFEIPEDAKFFTPTPENVAETSPALNTQEPVALSAEDAEENVPLDDEAESLTALMAEIENLEPEEFDRLEREIANAETAEPASEMTAAPEIETTAEATAPSIEAEKTLSETPDVQTAGTQNFSDASSTLFSDWSTEKKSDAPEPTIFQTEYTPPTTAETIRNSGLAWSAGIVFFAAVVFMMIFGWFADLLFGSSPWGLVGGIILGGIIGFIQIFRISSQIFKK